MFRVILSSDFYFVPFKTCDSIKMLTMAGELNIIDKVVIK